MGKINNKIILIIEFCGNFVIGSFCIQKSYVLKNIKVGTKDIL